MPIFDFENQSLTELEAIDTQQIGNIIIERNGHNVNISSFNNTTRISAILSAKLKDSLNPLNYDYYIPAIYYATDYSFKGSCLLCFDNNNKINIKTPGFGSIADGYIIVNGSYCV